MCPEPFDIFSVSADELLTALKSHPQAYTTLFHSIWRFKEGKDLSNVTETRFLEYNSLIRRAKQLCIFGELIEPLIIAKYHCLFTEKEAELAAVDCPLLRIESFVNLYREESAILVKFFPSDTTKKLKVLMKNDLILPFSTNFLQNHFSLLMDKFGVDSGYPKIVLELAGIANIESLFKDSFRSFVTAEVVEILTNGKGDFKTVECIFSLKKTLEDVIRDQFENESGYLDIVRDSFEESLNKPSINASKMIAEYLHAVLSCRTVLPHQAALDKLNNAIAIFRFIHSKDTFENSYKKDLCDRLIYSQIHSMDFENLVISQLKELCGASYTLKLESMFQDIEVSRDISKAFADVHSTPFHIKILNAHHWPLTPFRSEATLPSAVTNYQKTFEKYYHQTYPNRKLLWDDSRSTCTIIAPYPKVRVDVRGNIIECRFLCFRETKNFYCYYHRLLSCVCYRQIRE